MAKNGNGTLRIILIVIGILVTLALAGTSAVLKYGNQAHQVEDNCKTIGEMEPEIKKNSEHRIQDKVDTKYFKEKIENIEVVQKQILDEVRK